MALFKKKSPEYVDLGERLRKKEEGTSKFKQNNSTEQNSESPTPNSGFFGFFGSENTASETQSQPKTKKIKILDKLRKMTTQLEEQENEIYKLKQRLEILEKKQRLNY